MSALPRALFVCVQNAGRSQMAHALWERAGGEARSAGSRPATDVHPVVADAMDEIGVDLRSRVPRALTREDAEWADVIVTMGCGDACPVIPGRRYLEWDLPDADGRDVDVVRQIRDEIARRIAELAAGDDGVDR